MLDVVLQSLDPDAVGYMVGYAAGVVLVGYLYYRVGKWGWRKIRG